jgi:hypothetical protein
MNHQPINDRMFSSVPFLQSHEKVSSGDHEIVLAGSTRESLRRAYYAQVRILKESHYK